MGFILGLSEGWERGLGDGEGDSLGGREGVAWWDNGQDVVTLDAEVNVGVNEVDGSGLSAGLSGFTRDGEVLAVL